MAYKRITLMDIGDIIRRWHDGQSVSHISTVLQYDRKTVRKYIHLAQHHGLALDESLPDMTKVRDLLQGTVAENKKPATALDTLTPFLAEITELVKEHGLKAKTAFEVICQRHDLTVSYSTFKRFVKKNRIIIQPEKSTCRIEVDPGLEVQVDYAKMGLIYDPLTNRRRTVYAFIATLAHSRHKYIEFVFKQDQQSFTASHINMFEYFAGVPSRVVIDNLKSGVIKPDLYDPKLNRTFREMSEHYDCFIDPARVRHPKDKGKVERDVQTVRDQFRKLLALHPSLDIPQTNRLIKKWCETEYGQKPHGTTRLKPFVVFTDKEQRALKPLPSDPFDIALWKEATVHPDHYIQFNKKAYSVPHAYVGEKVWVKGTAKIVQIYHNEQLIKQHVITERFRHTDLNDFPQNVQAALDQGLPRQLQQKAHEISPAFGQLIRAVLEPHAFLNLRKAQGLLGAAQIYNPKLIDQASKTALEQQLQMTPKLFKELIQKIKEKQNQQHMPALSQASLEFVRQADYFVH
jgi:transposase